jgi:hypothetical protein
MNEKDVVNLGTGWATVFYRKRYYCNLCLDHVQLLFEALAVLVGTRLPALEDKDEAIGMVGGACLLLHLCY